MSSNFIIIYLTAIITLLLGISGFIMLIYGLVNKQKKLTITGCVFSFVAILIVVFGVLCSVRKFVRFAIDTKEIHMKHCCRPHHFCMPFDSEFTVEDSLNVPGDTGKVCLEKKIVVGNHMKLCNPNMKCDPAKCKQKCQHHNQ
jgi:hypothetical protein